MLVRTWNLFISGNSCATALRAISLAIIVVFLQILKRFNDSFHQVFSSLQECALVFAVIVHSEFLHSESLFIARVDPLTSILAVLARSCQVLSTSWQPWIPWQDSY